MKLNPAQQAELDRLSADQEADDVGWVRTDGVRSLDVSLHEEGDSAYERLSDDDRLDGGPVRSRPKPCYKIRPEQVKEWRALRKEGWTYKRIAEYAGVRDWTVRQHISRLNGERVDNAQLRLEQRLDGARQMYEAGAVLREIAEVMYEEVGYGSWQSCYQGLLRLFKQHGIPTRSKRISRNGRPDKGASRKEWQRYWRRMNQAAKKRRHAKMERCDGLVDGRPCHRFVIRGSRFCSSHDPETKQQVKWTKEAIIEALGTWAEEHSRNPKTKDWFHAAEDHPSAKTVIDRFGRWNVALYEAGLRKRKNPKQRQLGRRAKLARGYKECARDGCGSLVPASWRYCRDRHCQDKRFVDRMAA